MIDRSAQIEMVANAINEAIPDGAETGVVLSALCTLLDIGLRRVEDPEPARAEIVRIFSSWTRHQ